MNLDFECQELTVLGYNWTLIWIDDFSPIGSNRLLLNEINQNGLLFFSALESTAQGPLI